MSTEGQLPKDPAEATKLLAALVEKDQNETVCRYPTCHETRQTTTGTGRPSAYCQNPEHTAVSNHRARQQLRATAAGMTTETTPKREHPFPAVDAPVESLRASVVARIAQLQGDLERYLAALSEIADPDLAAATIQATLDQAEARVAEAQLSASKERSLRLAADTARMAAQEETRAEREAAELAIQRLEEAEARIQSQKEEIERIQAERDDTVNRVRIEAQRTIEEVEQQARKDVALAQAATTAAEVQASQADAHAAEARAQAATARALVQEVQTALDRERTEVDRLRSELATTIMDARTRAEADRAEARVALDRERAEVDRLRAELSTTRTRADQLTAALDALREQFVQVTQREIPHQ